MKTFIILLRAVNVSGKNIIKMADLKSHLDKLKVRNVQTYIQSGNIVLQSNEDKKYIQHHITKLITDNFNYQVPTFVLQKKELHSIIENNPFPKNLPPNKVYITLLDHIPDQEDIDNFNQMDLGEEKYAIFGDVCYFYVPKGMANTKLSNTFIESKLKVIATSRNLNTIQKLQELTHLTYI